jgi:alkylhydroperoxidase family enzyme
LKGVSVPIPNRHCPTISDLEAREWPGCYAGDDDPDRAWREIMAHIAPTSRAKVPEFEGYFQGLEVGAGYVPNAFLTMARIPALFAGYVQFSLGLAEADSVDRGLKVLMSHIASSAFGCRFCEAHSGSLAVHRGVEADKVANVWEFEQSDLFSEAERAALRFARDMGQVPNAVTADHFVDLRRHFTEDQIVEMVAAVCMFGFWNRWNDTMATDLEEPIYKVASAVLGPRGWSMGKFAVEEDDEARTLPAG